jgi:hypothetical protein
MSVIMALNPIFTHCEYRQPAQRIGSPAADLNKTTDSGNHFFYQMAAADRAEGGQVELVLGAG